MIGSNVFREVDERLWNVQSRLRAMDDNEVERQFVSPVPVTLDPSNQLFDQAAYVRLINRGVSHAVNEAPDRLVGLGAVPLRDPDLAEAELDYVVQELGLAGVEIGCGAGERALDDPALRTFFARADKLGALIFVHPLAGGAGAIRRRGQPYDFGLGMLTDTAIAAGELLFGGVLDACPDLHVLLAHGCGTFPWALPRLMAATALGGDSSSGAHDQLARRLWVDTLVFDAEHLNVLAHHFGSDHLVLGSDFPFVSGQLDKARSFLEQAEGRGEFSAAEVKGILGGNAQTLLSKLCVR